MSAATAKPFGYSAYSVLDANLAAAFCVNRAEFHPDYPDGMGQVDLISAHSKKKGWYFKDHTAEGDHLNALRAGWDDPGPMEKFAELLNKVEGPLGAEIQAAYGPFVMGVCRCFIQTRNRFLERQNGKRTPWYQIDRGKHRYIFKAEQEDFRKQHNIR